jgi:hypothetical protein
MTHRWLFALAAVTISAAPSIAQTVPFAFVGSVVITERQGTDCDSVNVQVGELHTSVYRPVQSGVNVASLQLLQDQVAIRLQPRPNGNFAASGQYLARMFSGRGGYVQFLGNYAAFRVRPTPTSTTPVLDISGRINNFKNAGSCTVTFAGGYVLKPASQ